jgi:hypothetical protein
MHSASLFSSSTWPLPSSAQKPPPASRLPSLAGIAAEAEGLQVAEVVRTSPVPGHDVVHLQGSLVQVLLSNSLRRSSRSGLWHG